MKKKTIQFEVGDIVVYAAHSATKLLRIDSLTEKGAAYVSEWATRNPVGTVALSKLRHAAENKSKFNYNQTPALVEPDVRYFAAVNPGIGPWDHEYGAARESAHRLINESLARVVTACIAGSLQPAYVVREVVTTMLDHPQFYAYIFAVLNNARMRTEANERIEKKGGK